MWVYLGIAEEFLVMHIIARNAGELLHCKRILWIMFQEMGRHPLGGIRGKVVTLSTSVVRFECSSIFVEPLRWMKTVEEGALEGKPLCVHCEACLGYFNWSGIQCSCGSWITPAFQLHKSLVDISTI